MLYFDDIGLDYQSVIGTWQLTEQDVIDFARRWDPQPFHMDAVAARDSIFGELVASSLHIFAVCTRLFFDHEDHIAIMAMLGKDKIRLHSPARATDLLTYSTRCIGHKPSSKTDRGVIVLADQVTRSDGDTVMTQEVTLLVAARR